MGERGPAIKLSRAERATLKIALWFMRLRYEVFGQTLVLGQVHVRPVPNLVVFINHRRIEDSFFVGQALFGRLMRQDPDTLPWNVPKRRWYTRIPPINLILRQVRTIRIKVDRHHQPSDPAAIRRIIRTLKAGQTVMLFPEGTRSETDVMGPLLVSACLVPLMASSSLMIVFHTYTPHPRFHFWGAGYTGQRRTVAASRILTPAEVAELAGSGSLREQSEQLASRLTEKFAELREFVLARHQAQRC